MQMQISQNFVDCFLFYGLPVPKISRKFILNLFTCRSCQQTNQSNKSILGRGNSEEKFLILNNVGTVHRKSLHHFSAQIAKPFQPLLQLMFDLAMYYLGHGQARPNHFSHYYS